MGSIQKLRAQGLAIKYELRRLGHWADYERAVAALDKTFDLYRLGKTYPNLMQRLLAFEEVALRARFLDDFPITEGEAFTRFIVPPKIRTTNFRGELYYTGCVNQRYSCQ